MSAAKAQDGYFRLISGERRGPGAAALRGLLWAASLLYRGFMAVRRLYYGAAAVRVPLPVLSVGNLTVGGTGKTPLVALLARRLVELGHRPLIVSRGYARGRSPRGDEAGALRLELPATVAHVESPNRAAAIRSAIAARPHDVVILDDGFQHLRLRRDLDLVTIDATRPFGPPGPGAGSSGHLLPRGLLREPPGALRRADAVVITRADQVSLDGLADLEARIRRHMARGATLLHGTHAAVRLRRPDGRTEPVEHLRGARVYAFCGLGNPEAFRRTLESLGAQVVAGRDFPDHCRYGERDLVDIIAEARSAGVSWIVTTTKDFVKAAADERAGLWPAEPPLAAVEVEMRLSEGAEALDGLLRQAVGLVP